MAAIINAVSGGAGGLQSKGDASGALNIQTASTTAIAIDASQNVTFTNAPTSATIKSAAVNTPTVFQDSAGTQVGTLCRAWVNFDGTTGTIKAAFNVSSITKNGTGDYTANFTNAMTDVNYVSTVTTLQRLFKAESSRTTSALRFVLSALSGTVDTSHSNVNQPVSFTYTATDDSTVQMAVFR